MKSTKEVLAESLALAVIGGSMALAIWDAWVLDAVLFWMGR